MKIIKISLKIRTSTIQRHHLESGKPSQRIGQNIFNTENCQIQGILGDRSSHKSIKICKYVFHIYNI